MFPVGRISRKLKTGGFYWRRVGAGAPVYLAAVLEYLVADILEISGSVARDQKKRTIHPKHIMMAFRTDAELHKVFGGVIVPGSGVPPMIHKVLLPKTKRNAAD